MIFGLKSNHPATLPMTGLNYEQTEIHCKNHFTIFKLRSTTEQMPALVLSTYYIVTVS
jgi:hypothetical protein